MAEEQVINETPAVSTPAAQTTEDLAAKLQEANERAIKAEALAEQQRKAAEEAEQKFKNAKSKIGQYYDDRNQALEDQGAYKPLWEEANKTNQDLQAENNQLKQTIEDLKSSNEAASTRTEALAAISNIGAINAEQTLSLMENKLQKNAQGNVVVLNGGVEQDLTTYLTSLKNPGSGWEHHFKPSSAAGMGAKPTPIASTGEGQVNPWKTGNITQQMIISNENPELAAVLKREAQ
tara:strand:- start:482 stop:1186 length:705 start_codon:yes stop_codon:yes gene_type:complete